MFVKYQNDLYLSNDQVVKRLLAVQNKVDSGCYKLFVCSRKCSSQSVPFDFVRLPIDACTYEMLLVQKWLLQQYFHIGFLYTRMYTDYSKQSVGLHTSPSVMYLRIPQIAKIKKLIKVQSGLTDFHFIPKFLSTSLRLRIVGDWEFLSVSTEKQSLNSEVTNLLGK